MIGLSCALCCQQGGYNVTIIAQDFPASFETIDPKDKINYASPWAGAHNRWVLPTNPEEERQHAFAVATFSHMESLVQDGDGDQAGLRFMKGIEYLECPPRVNLDLSEDAARSMGMKHYHPLDKEELPEGVEWGCEYQTWCVNPMIYCCYLLRRFTHLGGKIHKRRLREPNEVFSLEGFGDLKTVVNCSGYGFGDSKVFPTRGEFLLSRWP